MNVSIVIPALNEAAVIGESIQRAWLAGAYEVIVVDGGSSDETRSIAASANCTVIESASGRGLQLNAGASIAKGDVLLFLHADNWLKPNAVRQIADAVKSSELVGGAFHQHLNSGRLIYRAIEFGNAWRARRQKLVYGDQGLFVVRSHFESLGGFAELKLMEDYEFSQRCFRQHSPVLLDGPIYVDVRRWEQLGPIRTTIRNWKIARDWRLGASADELYQRYYNR